MLVGERIALRNSRFWKKNPLIQILLFLCLGLVACGQAQLDLNLEPGGSGEITITIGFDQDEIIRQRQAGENSFERFIFQQENPQTQYLPWTSLEQWTADGLIWLRASRTFAYLDEINALAIESGLFESFNILHIPGFFQDRYRLTAKLVGLDQDFQEVDIPLNLINTMELRTVVRMPGLRQETNGIVFPANRMSSEWRIMDADTPWMQTTSFVLNWLNIGIVVIGLLAVFVLSLLVITFFPKRTISTTSLQSEHVYTQAMTPSTERMLSPTSTFSYNDNQRSKADTISSINDIPGEAEQSDDRIPSPVSEIQPVSEGDHDHSTLDEGQDPILVELKARPTLEDFNRQVLGGRGRITEHYGSLMISWPLEDNLADRTEIRIRAVGDWLVTINGQHVPMTPEGLKRSLIACFQDLRNAGRA